MTEFIVTVRDLLWDNILIVMLMGCGVYITIKSHFLQIRKAPAISKTVIKSLFATGKGSCSVTSFQAVSTALAGTMGTGNIAGIATAIVAGGPGAVFWMWVSAFFGMAIKYTEVALAVKYRKQRADGTYYGGPMVYIREGLGSTGLAMAFSVCCIFASFGVGNATQIHSAAAALESTFSVHPLTTGLVAAIVTGFVLIGGMKRIGRVAESVIPLLCVLYILGGSAVLYINRDYVVSAFVLIFDYAFSADAFLGGVGGYTFTKALRIGVARGVFSNEAGLGSAPIAHACADAKTPAQQGFFGVFEVFIDTIVVCTFTAIIILSTPQLWQSGLDGAKLTTFSFQLALGDIGAFIVAVSLALFSIATLFSWGYYGERAVAYISGGKNFYVLIYRLVFVLVAAISPLLKLETVWVTSDILNGLMALPNMIAVLALYKEVLVKSKKREKSCISTGNHKKNVLY